MVWVSNSENTFCVWLAEINDKYIEIGGIQIPYYRIRELLIWLEDVLDELWVVKLELERSVLAHRLWF